MKLIIQIPCFNEEKTLKSVLEEIPKKIEWISEIETMIIDDWSSDETIKVARENWVDHIIKHIGNKEKILLIGAGFCGLGIASALRVCIFSL